MSSTAVNLSSKTLEDHEVDERLRTALRSRAGRATESDMIVDSGLPPHLLGPSLRRIMLAHECAIETTEDGDVVYVFDAQLAVRNDDPGRRWREFRRAAWAGFRAFFKVAITVVLISYFLIVVALVLAAIVAVISGSRSSSSSSSSRSSSRSRSSGSWWSSSSGSSSGSSDFSLWVWLVGDDDYRSWRRSSRPARRSTSNSQLNALQRYESSRWATDEGERTAAIKLPFHKKVFAFVFGREEQERDELFTEKQLLAYIRSVGGVVSPTDLAARTGWSVRAAEKRSTRLIAEYGGDVEVTDEGEILYVFPELMATAGSDSADDVQPAPLIWHHYETRQPLTGNSIGANLGIALLNASVMLGALVLIPSFAAPVLGLDMTPPVVHFVMYTVPTVYSVLFFAIPIYRALFQVGPENRRRARRNSQRALLEQIHERSLPAPRPMLLTRGDLDTPFGIDISIDSDDEFETALREVADDYRAEATLQDDGTVAYTFDRIATENRAAEQARALGGDLAITRIGDRVTAQLRS